MHPTNTKKEYKLKRKLVSSTDASNKHTTTKIQMELLIGELYYIVGKGIYQMAQTKINRKK